MPLHQCGRHQRYIADIAIYRNFKVKDISGAKKCAFCPFFIKKSQVHAKYSWGRGQSGILLRPWIFVDFWSFCLLVEGFGEQRSLLSFFLEPRSRFIVFLLLLEHIRVHCHPFQLEEEPLPKPSPLPVKGAEGIASLFYLISLYYVLCAMYYVDLSWLMLMRYIYYIFYDILRL